MSTLLVRLISAGVLCGPAWALDDVPAATEDATPSLTDADAPVLPAVEAPPFPEPAASPLPAEEAPPLPEPIASPLSKSEEPQPEPEASPLPDVEAPAMDASVTMDEAPDANATATPDDAPASDATAAPDERPVADAADAAHETTATDAADATDEAPAVDAVAAPDDAPPVGSEEPTAPTATPADTEAPVSPAADEDAALPVADEDGVLPGLPEDRPGVGLDTDSVDPADVSGTPPGEGTAESATAEAPQPDVQETLFLLGTEVPPGAIDWLSWAASESFEGISTPTPVLVVNGTSPGPTLCLTAAIHGDELNGVEMVRRIMYSLDPKKLDGAVIGVPIVNLHGFRRSSRYLPDRRDLNRYFPGSPTGSSAARIAYSFFHEIIVHCDQLVDLHTGSFHRANLPQLRADLNIPEVVKMTEGFGATVVLHSTGTRGTLRRAATDAGIPALTLEAGEPMRLQPKEVAHGVKGIETLLDKLRMVNKVSLWGDPQPIYYDARWIRANSGGILFSNVNLGERIRKNEVLGTVTDPITNKRTEIRSPYDGRIIGRALNQVVMPGFAAFHIGIRTSEEQLRAESAATTAEAGTPAPEGALTPEDDDDAPAAEADAMQGEGEALGYEEEEERPE